MQGVNSFSSRINALKSDCNGGIVLDRLFEEVIWAKKKIEKLRKDDSLVFPVFTDLHAENVHHKYSQSLLALFKLITREIKYDAVIDMGDNFSMLGREIHISNRDLKIAMEEIFGAIYDVINAPLLLINGNHDAIGTDFFKPDFWNEATKNKFGNANAKYDSVGAYYYVDYDDVDTRLIALSLPSESDLEAEHPTPIWAFGKDQLRWLREIALDTTKNVILLSHVPFFYVHEEDEGIMLATWTGDRSAESYIIDLYGRIEDRDEATEILRDFYDKTGGKLIACLSGHTHYDSIWKPYETARNERNPLPCHQIVTTGVCIPECEHSQFGIAVDILIWTPSENDLHVIRVGDGEDRDVQL